MSIIKFCSLVQSSFFLTVLRLAHSWSNLSVMMSLKAHKISTQLGYLSWYLRGCSMQNFQSTLMVHKKASQWIRLHISSSLQRSCLKRLKLWVILKKCLIRAQWNNACIMAQPNCGNNTLVRLLTSDWIACTYSQRFVSTRLGKSVCIISMPKHSSLK